MRTIDVKSVAFLALGLGIALALSSLLLWESDWTSSAFPLFNVHGISLIIGFAISLVAFFWAYLDPRSLHIALAFVLPAVVVASLLLSSLGIFQGTLATNIFRFVVPGIGPYVLMFLALYVLSTKTQETAILGVLGGWILSVIIRWLAGSVTDATGQTVLTIVLFGLSWALILSQTPAEAKNHYADENQPRLHKASYAHALKNIWVCSLYCGTLAFLGGVIRSVTLSSGVMSFINTVSIIGGLVATVILALIWQVKTIRYSINMLYRAVFPFLIIALCTLPFLGTESFAVVAALLYILYSFFGLSLQIICVQTSYDFGVNVIFCIAFQTVISTLMQGMGYCLGGYSTNLFAATGVDAVAIIAIFALAVLALVMYFTRGQSLSAESEGRNIELLSLSREITVNDTAPEIPEDDFLDTTTEVSDRLEEIRPPEQKKYEDRIAMRCDKIGTKYYLSQREIEIMTLLARGNTIATIAQELYISENTVKTHMRRLYGKLNISKKQQLFDLLNSYID